MDKNIIPKKTYRAIYRLLDSVSPADFDCGQLCGAVCCLSESDDMGIYLLPGEERCVNFRDSDGIPKVHYTYCSLHGRLFNCTCRSKDEAQRLCEDWLVTQDRCYIN